MAALAATSTTSEARRPPEEESVQQQLEAAVGHAVTARKQLATTSKELEALKARCRDLEESLGRSEEDAARFEGERVASKQKLQEEMRHSKQLKELLEAEAREVCPQVAGRAVGPRG